MDTYERWTLHRCVACGWITVGGSIHGCVRCLAKNEPEPFEVVLAEAVAGAVGESERLRRHLRAAYAEMELCGCHLMSERPS